jgi:MoaA/NifB/PqqE/SkfB family radical SAM enzyme
MKTRKGPDGVHLFDRKSGLNILLDEVDVPAAEWSVAPRQVSVALLNACDLQCAYCYAPKQKAILSRQVVERWLVELSEAGCLGIGFGGGEPTLHPDFAAICQFAERHTDMAVTFTTHGHRLNQRLLDQLNGSVHFIRVSMDGVGSTYEALRGKPFESLITNIRRARAISAVGLNVVVNDYTVTQLDEISKLATELDVTELLLLPQQPTATVAAASDEIGNKIRSWLQSYKGSVRLAVSENGVETELMCNPLPKEKGLRSYAHVNANGVLKTSSYATLGQPIGDDGIIAALQGLNTMEDKT